MRRRLRVGGNRTGSERTQRVDIAPGRRERSEAVCHPPDNLFVGVEGARPEIWVYGVRNPWRFSFDVATGDLYVPDPGVAHWEELTFLREGSAAGANLGWPAAQGNECREACSADDLVWPVHVYPFGERGCSIIDGAVYRGEAYPDWNGVYVFSDFCTGDVWRSKTPTEPR